MPRGAIFNMLTNPIGSSQTTHVHVLAVPKESESFYIFWLLSDTFSQIVLVQL